MKKLIHKLETIQTKRDFIDFIELLIEDLKNDSTDWKNKNLKSYLEAIANWTEDMDGYYLNNSLSIPQNVNWKVFADILIAAKMYE